MQRDQNRVRVNAQLIDTESGAHLWANRFEEDLADLFKLQDQVVARLANSLGYQLVKAEAEKAARSKNPDAIDLAMHGWALIWLEQQPPTKDSYIVARASFNQALNIDPNDADALAGEAMTYLGEYLYGWTNPETDYDAKIVGQTERAIALDPDNMRAYYVKSLYLLLTQRRRRRVGDQSEFRPAVRDTRRRRKFYQPLRTSEIRFATRDAVKSARPGNRFSA